VLASVLAGTALVAASGCGPTDREELKRRVDTISSLAAEGKLLADGVAKNDTKATFVRVHGAEISEAADHEAEKLNDAHVEAQLAEARNQTIELAVQVADAVDTLRISPGSVRQAERAREELSKAADESTRLSEQL
jgi:4-hydroxy-3-methylbut-2-en-1-yl diphosphate synthase IspG/GcpE